MLLVETIWKVSTRVFQEMNWKTGQDCIIYIFNIVWQRAAIVSAAMNFITLSDL